MKYLSQNRTMLIHEIIRNERKRLNLSQTELTFALNEIGVEISTSKLSRIELGGEPDWSTVAGCCVVFGLSLDQLEHKLGGLSLSIKEDPSSYSPTKDRVTALGREIPIVSWVAAGGWNESPNIENYEQEKIFVTGNIPPNSYALKVSGTSMENSTSAHTFPDGSIIIVNPEKEPKDKDFVVAFDESTCEATFKQYIDDCGTKFFKPLNPQFPVMKVTESTVIKGVVFRKILDVKL